jgi:hypothetical protein
MHIIEALRASIAGVIKEQLFSKRTNSPLKTNKKGTSRDVPFTLSRMNGLCNFSF